MLSNQSLQLNIIIRHFDFHEVHSDGILGRVIKICLEVKLGPVFKNSEPLQAMAIKAKMLHMRAQ